MLLELLFLESEKPIFGIKFVFNLLTIGIKSWRLKRVNSWNCTKPNEFEKPSPVFIAGSSVGGMRASLC